MEKSLQATGQQTALENIPVVTHSAHSEAFFQEGYRYKTSNGRLCILQDEKVRNIGKTDTNQSFAWP